MIDPKWYGSYHHKNRSDTKEEKCPLNYVSVSMRIYPERLQHLKVGDIVRMPFVKQYQHGATMMVTKINKKGFKATEIKGSYGQGTNWNIHVTYDSLQVDPCYMSHERLLELAKLWNK